MKGGEFMKALVVYDSNYGNTQMIANAIAKQLGTKAVNVADFSKEDLKEIELLVVGSPINAWGPTAKIKKFLNNLTDGDLDEVKVAAFDTRVKLFIHGDAAKKISKGLKKAGGKVIARPQGFIVEGTEGPLGQGEADKAIDWAKAIKDSSASGYTRMM